MVIQQDPQEITPILLKGYRPTSGRVLTLQPRIPGQGIGVRGGGCNRSYQIQLRLGITRIGKRRNTKISS